MQKKSNKLYRDTIKEHLKKLQKEDPEITLISADGSPRSDRDEHENMYKIGIVDDDYFPDKTVLKYFDPVAVPAFGPVIDSV